MTAAERKRRERLRKRRGVQVPRVEIDPDVQNQLEAEGLLREFEGADNIALGRAAAIALRIWADEKKASRVTLDRPKWTYANGRKDQR